MSLESSPAFWALWLINLCKLVGCKMFVLSSQTNYFVLSAIFN
jgi:hypothetical protein